MKAAAILSVLTATLSLPITPAMAGDEPGEQEPFEGMPLIVLMHNMQYYGHKLGLSVTAGNQALQHFYAHELEEVIEAVAEIDDYEGIAVHHVLGETLKPAFEALEEAIEGGDQVRVSTRYDALLESCNACHRAAGRPFVVIRRNDQNPYPQDFAPRP